MEILDMKCAQYGSKIALASGIDETLITKALGILQEDGVYAFFLWCASKAGGIKEKSFVFLQEDGILKHLFDGEIDQLKAIREKFDDKLDELLFAKELLERTLIYARYHAKALANSKAEETSGEAGE